MLDQVGGINAMIRNFHVLYVGQIELDNIGRFRHAWPINGATQPNGLREVFATAREIAQLMDRLGYVRVVGRPSITSSGRVTSACPI